MKIYDNNDNKGLKLSFDGNKLKVCMVEENHRGEVENTIHMEMNLHQMLILNNYLSTIINKQSEIQLKYKDKYEPHFKPLTEEEKERFKEIFDCLE